LGNSFTHFEFTTAGNARFAGGGRKGIGVPVCVLLALQRKLPIRPPDADYTLFLRANEACSNTAAHTLSGRQSRHLILQVRRHFIAVDLSSNRHQKKLESASQNFAAT